MVIWLIAGRCANKRLARILRILVTSPSGQKSLAFAGATLILFPDAQDQDHLHARAGLGKLRDH
jgi:hypothetical protein